MMLPAKIEVLYRRAENRRLTYANASLKLREGKLRTLLRAAQAERDQARRDCDLLTLMARDGHVAREFIETRHEILDQPEIGTRTPAE